MANQMNQCVIVLLGLSSSYFPPPTPPSADAGGSGEEQDTQAQAQPVPEGPPPVRPREPRSVQLESGDRGGTLDGGGNTGSYTY